MISYYINANLEQFLLIIRWSNPQCFIVKSSIFRYLSTISHDQIMIKSIQVHSSSAFFSISHAFFSISHAFFSMFPCACSMFFTKISYPRPVAGSRWSSRWHRPWRASRRWLEPRPRGPTGESWPISHDDGNIFQWVNPLYMVNDDG